MNDVYSKILGLRITLLFSQMKSAKRLKGILEAHPWNMSQKPINRQTHKPILRGLGLSGHPDIWGYLASAAAGAGGRSQARPAVCKPLQTHHISPGFLPTTMRRLVGVMVPREPGLHEPTVAWPRWEPGAAVAFPGSRGIPPDYVYS